jgi:prepilin signal peptidase PulO-like enzyme (type II secretory pathway)
MEFLIYIFVFILGLIVGSFLNCVIYRLETGESFLKGRSYCPHCKHVLAWKDLIPLFSFLILKGKCRYCKKKISLQYPLVELFTGILFALAIPIYGGRTSINLIFYWILTCFLVVIFVFDLKHYLIPDRVIYPAIFLTLFYQLLRFTISDLQITNLIFGISPSLFFLAIILISHETWIGFGDFKLSILMGLILGWPKILIALFFSFLSGALVGLVLILLKKKKMKSQVPFAPFLVLGTFFSIFFGQKIIDFYLNLILL